MGVIEDRKVIGRLLTPNNENKEEARRKEKEKTQILLRSYFWCNDTQEKKKINK